MTGPSVKFVPEVHSCHHSSLSDIMHLRSLPGHQLLENRIIRGWKLWKYVGMELRIRLSKLHHFFFFWTGKNGECFSPGWRCDSQGWTVHQWRQNSTSQVYRRICTWPTDHYVMLRMWLLQCVIYIYLYFFWLLVGCLWSVFSGWCQCEKW